MAKFNLRGKTITVSDEDVQFMKKAEFCDFNEDDLIDIIYPVITTGDFEKGFTAPDIDDVIAENTDEQLSALVKRGIDCIRQVVKG